MREATARAESFSVHEEVPWVDAPEGAVADTASLRPPRVWNAEAFAREQIQGLVRAVFLANSTRPVRQVVFSAVEPETDVRVLCRRVGEALAAETPGTVSVMGGCPQLGEVEDTKEEQGSERGERTASVPPLRRIATRVRGNLWLVPCVGNGNDQTTTASLHSYLGELRREFEYSIIQGPTAGETSEATAMAQFADGIILVLSAQRTRRITARKIMDGLLDAQARVLGTVLSDRMFPIPEKIYRRL
jgi:hypothetical protein